MKSVFQLVLTALIAVFSSSLAQAASFTFTPLPLLARGLNNAGQVVGYDVAGETTYGVLYDQGTLTSLFVPGSSNTLAFGINNQSQITGYYSGIRSGLGSFLYDHGQFTSFQGPGNVETRAQGINDRKQVVGYDLGTGTGSRGFLYADGIYQTFAVPGAVNTRLTSINNAGMMVGYYNTTQKTSGFLMDTSGAFTPLDAPGSVSTFVYGINNLGQIVGSYVESNGVRSHGFLYQDGVFTTIDITGTVQGTDLYGINDQGEILAQVGGGSFLGTPVPEPASLALFASGLIGCCLLSGRKQR